MRNLGTRSHALGAQLRDWAGTLLFLSATPLNLGNDDLFNLLELLNPDEFDDRYALQTRLEPNAVLNRVSASLADDTIPNGHRRAWLQSIRNMTFGRPVADRPEYHRLEEILALQNLRPPEKAEATRLLADLNTLSSVVTRTRKAEVDEDKTVRDADVVEALTRIVGQGRKVLVFTFSRPAVAYLGDRLSTRFRTCLLHGGVPQAERRGVIRRFRDGDFDVMLATRVAGEGSRLRVLLSGSSTTTCPGIPWRWNNGSAGSTGSGSRRRRSTS